MINNLYTRIVLFSISCLLFKITSTIGEPKCKMYGMADPHHNYYYDGPPKPITGKSKELFISLCHNLLPEGYKDGDTINACCSENQLVEFDSKISLATTLVPDCGICVENIKRLTCNLICHPYQADFTDIMVLNKSSNLVDGVKFAISNEFSIGLFNSCKDVKFPNSALPVLGFFCTSTITECNPLSLIESLFERSDFPITPVFFNWTQIVPSPFIRVMNESTMTCNTSYSFYSGTIKACSCQDCESSCPPIPDIPKDEENLIFNIFTIYQICVLSLFILFVILYTLSFTIVVIIKTRRENTKGIIITNQSENLPNIIPANETEYKALIYTTTLKETFSKKMQRFTQNILRQWGIIVSTHRILFIILPLVIVITLSFGILYKFQITSDPIDIWSSPNGEFRKQKDFFEANYGPFYRTEQIIIKSVGLEGYIYSNSNINIKVGPIINKTVIDEIFNIQNGIFNLSAKYESIVNGTRVVNQANLSDICYKPLSPSNLNCAFFSVTQYFQNSYADFIKLTDEDYDWHFHLANCINSPGNVKDSYFNDLSCISKFMAPIQPELIFGGYDKNPLESSALIISFVVNNYLDKEKNMAAIAWEKEFINYIRSYKHPNIEISYMSEHSVEDEIDRQSHGEILTVGISYLVMFLYVSFTLGRFPPKSFSSLLIQQKVLIGFIGVIMVLISVVASIGFFSYLGYKVTMIVLEVLPFLTLAVGVDNIFIIVHEYQRIQNEGKEGERTAHMVGEVMSRVGQGMIISAVAQVTTFSVGAVSTIPAVRGFSLFAAGALALNFFMQMTSFLAIFSFDIDREKAKRPNIFCCFKLTTELEYENKLGLLERLFELISKVTLNCKIKPLVIFLFVIGWFASIYVIPSISTGLDQTVALPIDSYLQNYFKDIFQYLHVGPPVYFVVSPGFHYENKIDRQKICSGNDCNNNSLTSLIYYQSRISNYSKIAIASDSWVDTFLGWIKHGGASPCCAYKNVLTNYTSYKSFCPSSEGRIPGECSPCINSSVPGFELTAEQFNEFLPWFLNDIPNSMCALGGKPAYGNSVIFDNNHYLIDNSTSSPIFTSRFMTYHSALATSSDFIQAMAQAQILTHNISSTLNHNVTAYSVFYIFYESYFTIWKDASISFGISFVAVLGVNLLLYGFDLKMSIIITFLIFIMNITNAGFMYALHINLNPVSLVNLVMFIGINVEFLSHIGRAFLSSQADSRVERAREALIHTGASVFSGIAMTKLLGVAVLAFSSSLLFKIYYFQMYSIAILVGTLHGLILLPVILSYIGTFHTSEPYSQEITSPFNEHLEVANV